MGSPSHCQTEGDPIKLMQQAPLKMEHERPKFKVGDFFRSKDNPVHQIIFVAEKDMYTALDPITGITTTNFYPTIECLMSVRAYANATLIENPFKA